MHNVKQVLNDAINALISQSPSPRLDAEILVSHMLKLSRSQLITQENTVLTEEQNKEIQKRIEQRISGLPIAYITGVKEFFSRDFEVNEHTLIPRPETEELIEYVLSSLPDTKNMLDLGTGSGCIAITLKKEKPEWNIYAADISKEALDVAQRNAQKHEADITFIESDLLQSSKLSACSFQLIIANLPYVPENERDPSIAYEPETALYSGVDGLDHYRKLAEQVSSKNCKHLVLEIADSQADAIKNIFPQAKSIKIIKDLAGQQRIAHISF